MLQRTKSLYIYHLKLPNIREAHTYSNCQPNKSDFGEYFFLFIRYRSMNILLIIIVNLILKKQLCKNRFGIRLAENRKLLHFLAFFKINIMQ